MPSFLILSTLFGAFVAAAVVEYRRHQRRIIEIPHRIHVNGTRGKSSVTRLIGAGLRAGGLRTITKVTGTFPRLILPDGSDVPVHRKAAASILEQLDIVDFAARREAEVLVIECMALDPDFQWITEHQMVHATLPVMTNIRLDHTDVMGRTLAEVGASMANTIPHRGRLWTGEQEHLDLIRRLAAERRTEVVAADVNSVSNDEMAGFSYIEHRENVALALAVCAELGVDREVALAGMWRAAPDAGVLTRFRVHEPERTVTFFNAFAANDPESSWFVWNKLADEGQLLGERFVLLNSRADRKERSEQLAHLIADRLGDQVDAIFVMGRPTDVVVRLLRSLGVDADRIVDLGAASADQVYAAIVDRTRIESSVVAIGNMGGQGAATVDRFEARSGSAHD
ncbi:MAG: poly-gamma-glutamate synthase PgsB [Acidobacteriota bacterium]